MKSESSTAPYSLHHLLDRLSVATLPAAVRRHSFIINEVDRDLHVNTDEHTLAAIVGSLLSTVINSVNEACIRLSAKSFGDVVLLSLHEVHRANEHRFSANIRELQQLAERIGGTVSMSRESGRSSSIVFTFTNKLPLAA